MFKKALALIMTVVMLASFMVLTASSASTNTPTRLYVGEKDKTEDNLIAMYNKEKSPITVLSVNDSDEYYTLDYDKDSGEYILTLDNYTYSEAVEYGSGKYGIYCDGDLNIVLKGTSEFDLSKDPEKGTPVTDAIGIYVKGTLTVVGHNGISGNLIANGDKRKASEATDSIGICAENLLINDATVSVSGGYAGAAVRGTLAVVDAEFYANTAEDMFSTTEINSETGKGKPLFSYGVTANIFVQGAVYDESSECVVAVGGDVDINSYVLEDNYDDDITGFVSEFDVNVVVYLKDFAILDAVKGETYKMGKEVKLIDKDLPNCFFLSSNDSKGDYLTISGKNAKIVGGEAGVTVGIYLNCGNATLCFDSTVIGCERTLLQKIIDFFAYYIFFGWLIAKI